MLEQLKAHFKNAMLIDQQAEKMDDYEWFCTNDGKQIGILKEALTDREKQLLSIFLIPLSGRDRLLTEEELAWHRFLVNGDHAQLPLLSTPSPYYRFIQFHMKQTTVDKTDFQEAIEGLFQEKVVIVWEHNQRGIIVERRAEETETDLPFHEMIDALSSDFYITLHLFIGQTHPYEAGLYHRFYAEKQYFHLAQTHIPTQTIYTIADVLPLVFIDQHPQLETIQQSLSFIKKIDTELLEVVKIFLQCNLNVSLAAKKLYMHRNSLQYRIDKFIEKTGIDIKHFKGAAAVYLAILANEYKKH
ncbi:PucR family transcriptional regulator [Anoxybacteroides tepidamans]|uniref:PucR family transcriptional regulator n=1 Tax=Anoxybacteroides tepidamans TaxID=265948 RepID=UPI000489789D|nr:helix-turn-helix domain-containing protein [Anoxybacillus tepidamans]